MKPCRVVVAGAIAGKPFNGGGVWERMSWAVGLRRLGCEVVFVDRISAASCVDAAGCPASFGESINRQWFESAMRQFGFDRRSSLFEAESKASVGLSRQELLEAMSGSDLLVNVSGHLTDADLLAVVGRRVYLDVDPGFTQLWHADPNVPFQVGGHDDYFTIGENIGSDRCALPQSGIRWRPVRQPVVLDDWPVAEATSPSRWTTIASWRGAYGPITWQGATLGVKAHEFRKVIDLPRRRDERFEIALEIHEGDRRDRDALVQRGWRLVVPREASGSPDAFRRYVQNSVAEFSVAQSVYAATNCGWFSDRTIRYLASGKPAVVQETGFSSNIPTGEGLLAFRTIDEAAESIGKVSCDYEQHARRARRLAEQYFASDVVLSRFLRDVDLQPGVR